MFHALLYILKSSHNLVVVVLDIKLDTRDILKLKELGFVRN